MVEAAARLVLAGVLAVAAILKLSRPRESAGAMATFGLARPATQWSVWALVVAAELGLGAGVALGAEIAAYLAAAMMVAFAAVMAAALLRGRAGRSCACFGPRSTLSWLAVARNAVLAAAFLSLPLLPESDLTTEQWLGLGLGLALVWAAGLTVATLALAREIGELRLRLGPAGDSALEIPEEGPPIGEQVPVPAGWETIDERAELLLATFLSEGCHICRGLEPQIRALARNPAVAARVFDEAADKEVWRAFDVPGSPYAVACDPDGTVLAKGSFNTIAQLEGVLAVAERRRAQAGAVLPGT